MHTCYQYKTDGKEPAAAAAAGSGRRCDILQQRQYIPSFIVGQDVSYIWLEMVKYDEMKRK